MICTKCKADKPPEGFAKNRSMKRGFSHWCKGCMKICLTAFHAKHGYPAQRMYERCNPEKAKAAKDRWSAANRERRRKTISAWHIANRDKVRARVAKRRAMKETAVPAWADDRKISALYRARLAAEELFGVSVHVDHVVPLVSKMVCGLHVDDNLRLIPAALNQSKGNHVWPDMWVQ